MILEKEMSDRIRWHARIFYRVDRGWVLEGRHDLCELEDLQYIVDKGPHWDCISEIRIFREHLPGLETLTIEESALLSGEHPTPAHFRRRSK